MTLLEFMLSLFAVIDPLRVEPLLNMTVLEGA